MDPIQLLVLIPIGLMAGWIRVLSGRIDKMNASTYNKDETKDMIKLYQEPLKVKIDNIEHNTSEILRKLEKLSDDKKQS